jgi:hypothetical protein
MRTPEPQPSMLQISHHITTLSSRVKNHSLFFCGARAARAKSWQLQIPIKQPQMYNYAKGLGPQTSVVIATTVAQSTSVVMACRPGDPRGRDRSCYYVYLYDFVLEQTDRQFVVDGWDAVCRRG